MDPAESWVDGVLSPPEDPHMWNWTQGRLSRSNFPRNVIGMKRMAPKDTGVWRVADEGAACEEKEVVFGEYSEEVDAMWLACDPNYEPGDGPG